MGNDLEIIKMVFEHIVRLHEIGIVADEAKIDEEGKEYNECIEDEDWDAAAIEFADLKIARLSFEISRLFEYSPNFFGAIAKNEPRIEWVIAHRDEYPDATPVELWKMSKVALEEKKNGTDTV